MNRRRGRHLWICLSLAVPIAPVGCESWRTPTDFRNFSAQVQPSGPAPVLPGKFSRRESQYVFYSNFPLEQQSGILTELTVLRDQVHRELSLPPSNTIIQVFLFETREKYDSYMASQYSDLPSRPAYFIAQPRHGGPEDLLVYTFWGDHIRQNLRHELTHALLHASLREVPLWLDEGIAEFFELPPENNGVNIQHLEKLRRGPFQPDLTRLEGLTQVAHMERAEYREAWAWVHLMLRGKPQARQTMLTYLHQFKNGGTTGKLAPKLQDVHPVLVESLAEHLSQVELPKLARTSDERK